MIGYLSSAGIIASSNPSVWASPRVKISFFVLSVCTEELLSDQKIAKCLHHLPFDHENEYQIQYHNNYICIFQDQHSWLTSELQTNNYLFLNLCLNLLNMHLVCKQNITLPYFYKQEIYCLVLNSFHLILLLFFHYYKLYLGQNYCLVQMEF